ncbi:MAG: SpaA isopeptide-forming pilin-related protein [Lachnospiraceae bacterium]
MKRKRRILAGALALLLGCSTLLNAGITAFAADISDTVESVDESETMVETEAEPTVATEELPELAAVQEQLSADEIAVADDLSIVMGERLDVDCDYTGLKFDDQKIKITWEKAENEKGQTFDYNKAGSYQAYYRVDPLSGHPSYQISRRIIVNEKEPQTQEQQETGGEAGSEEEGSEDDPDPAPKAEETTEQITEVPEVVEDVAEAVNVSDEENGVFLSVVPSVSEYQRGNVNLTVGQTIPYPSNLGNYVTSYFEVNGKVAYCLESMKASPPSSDYVANVYESNKELQKALYYGYGGPGDITGLYMPDFTWELKYVFTHLAAAYSYCGMDAFYGCSIEDVKKCGVWDYIQYLNALDAPPTAAISLTPTTTKATESGDIQKTENFKLSGDYRNYITLKLPADVTYHSGNTKKTGSVDIYGGTSFYFTAPKTVTGTWNSGKIQGQMGVQWKTLVLSTGSGTQDIGYGSFFDEDKGTVSFKVTWLDLAKVKIIKKDNETNVNLAGAVFGIYSDKGCTKLITKMPATDAQGASIVEIPKTQDTVYLKEISVPQGYKINTNAYNVTLKTGNTTSVTVTNQEQKGKITIRKTGEVLTGASGEEGNISFVYQNSSYAGAKYSIYAAEDIYSQDKATKKYNSGDLIGNMETGADGSCTSQDLYLGKYRIVEQQAPADLVIGKTEEERTKYVTLSYAGQTVELATGEAAYQNERPDISVHVVKKSQNDDVTLSDAVFGLYAADDILSKDGTVVVKSGTLIERVSSDTDGHAVFHSDLPINFHYSIKEIQAPDKYYMSTEVYEFFYQYKDDHTYTYTFTHEFKNKEVRGEVHVKKIDKDSQDFISQGDASLAGAAYGLYAAEDIEYPNKKSGIVYKKGELAAQGVISKEGDLDFINLYLGNYVVKEIAPGEGYLLDETEYPVAVQYEGQEVEIVHRYVTVKETVKKQAFQMIKISEDGEQTETDLVAGAGFKVFLISSLSGIKDGSLKPANGSSFTAEDFIAYDYSNDETASYYQNGSKINVPELITDKKGYLCSPELPYGKYVVFESTTPENLNTINPFIVNISEDSREPQVWRVFDDRPFQFFFKIVKKDAQTQKPVLDNSASYKIYDVDHEKYVEMIVRYPKEEKVSVFKTNEEGYLVTPEQLKSGTYRIEEVQAPNNYVQPGFENILNLDGEPIPLNQAVAGGEYQKAGKEAITIKVDSNTVHQVEEETGKFVVVVEQYNDEAVGSLTINKKGEKLVKAVNIEEKITSRIKNGIAALVNKVSNFLMDEDAMQVSLGYDFSYEESGMEGAEFAIYAKDIIYTPDGQKDETGNRIVKYEKDALVGKITTDSNGKAFLNNLPIGAYYLMEEKAGQNCVLDPEKKEFEIGYKGQEAAVDYVTMDLTNKRQHISIELQKKDAKTGKPIEGVVFGLFAEEDIKNALGKVVLQKDSLIELGETDKEGKLVFTADLPHGKYYVLEVEKKPGYLPNEEIYHFDASYTDSKKEIIALSSEIANKPTITEFTKTDLTGEKEVEGAMLQILKDNKVVKEWISGKEPHVVYALAPGDYVLHEEQAPTDQGYVRAEDMAFTVEETGEIQKVEMKDDHTKISISKTDITDGKEIQGAKLQIIDKEKNIFAEWTTGEEHLIEYIPVGNYTLHEEAAVDGYVLADDVSFSVKETGEIQKVQMKDERAMGRLVLQKTDTESKKVLEGVEFTLTDKGTGKDVAKLVTDKDGKAQSELLPIGTYENGVMKEKTVYLLRETKALEGYEKTEEEWEITFGYKDGKTPVIEVLKEIQNKKNPDTPKTPTATKPSSAPKTGDTTNWIWPMLVTIFAGAGIIGMIYWKIHRKRKQHKKTK